jgi:HK97 family phage major capsid protein
VTAPDLTIPTTAAELEDLFGDSARMQAVFADKTAFTTLIRNYASATQAKDPAIAAQVREETQRVLAQWAKDNNAASLPVDLTPDNPAYKGRAATKGTLYNKRAPGAKLDALYDGSADFFQSIWHRADSLRRDPQVRSAKLAKALDIQNSFGSEVPADGGFLIPEVLRSEILQVALESAIVRPRATVIPMESLRVPIPMIDSTSNVSSVFGGIVCYWTEEAAALTESQASFGRIVLDAKKLTGYAEFPNELIADASAFGAFFDQKFPQAVAWFEDVAFFTGTGAGEPLGFINCPASVAVTAESGQGANTIVWENIVKMYARMLPASLGSAVWIAAIDTFPQLATMALSVGTGGSAIWLNNGAQGPPMTILGRPVIFTEKASTLGTTGDISFVDLSYYLLGDRQVMMADSSPHFKFSSDKTAFRIIERVDGRPWLQSAITPKNNSSSTLTPFVQLSSTRT